MKEGRSEADGGPVPNDGRCVAERSRGRGRCTFRPLAGAALCAAHGRSSRWISRLPSEERRKVESALRERDEARNARREAWRFDRELRRQELLSEAEFYRLTSALWSAFLPEQGLDAVPPGLPRARAAVARWRRLAAAERVLASTLADIQATRVAMARSAGRRTGRFVILNGGAA